MTTVCEIHSNGRQLIRLTPGTAAEEGILADMSKRSHKGERLILSAKLSLLEGGGRGEFTLEILENGNPA